MALIPPRTTPQKMKPVKDLYTKRIEPESKTLRFTSVIIEDGVLYVPFNELPHVQDEKTPICANEAHVQEQAVPADTEPARWIHGNEYGDGKAIAATSYCCSNCGWAWPRREDLGFFSHCPSCTAKMADLPREET